MEGNDDEDGEEKVEKKDSEVKEEKTEGEEKETDTPMELEAEDDVDPLDAYMEEVKQEVKKFNIGAMKGNDKVRTKFDFHAKLYRRFYSVTAAVCVFVLVKFNCWSLTERSNDCYQSGNSCENQERASYTQEEGRADGKWPGCHGGDFSP